MSSGLTPASATKNPNSTSEAASANSGMQTGSASAPSAAPIRAGICSAFAPRALGAGTHPVDEPVHLFQPDVGLAVVGAGGDHGRAFVGLDRTFEDHVLARGQLGLDVVRMLARFGTDQGAVSRWFDNAGIKAAAHQIGDRASRLKRGDEVGI